MSKKVLIVGGVAGGASAAARLRRLNENIEIVMFERDGYISFANCGLPYYIGETIKDRGKLLVQTPEAMKNRFNIDVRINSEVVKVDASQKRVTVKSKAGGLYEEDYDYLILSPGGKPLKPNIPGINGEKIFTLRNIPDTDKIKAYVDQQATESVIVIGGGYIGVEMAENLKERGLKVTLVEAAHHILAPFDSEMATYAEKELVDHGIDVILGNGVKAFENDKENITVTLEDGQKLTSDIVILAIGVMPDTAFLKDSGIKIGTRGHIIVNSNMQTNMDGVYAVGDAVEIEDFINGQKAAIPLAGPANKQGRIAADNICGISSVYKGSQGTAIIKIFELTGASTGNNEKTLERHNIPYKVIYIHPQSHASYYPGAVPMSLKLIFNDEGKVLGAQGFGYDGVDKRIDVIASVIRLGGTVSDLAELELAYAPPFSSAKDPVNMAGFVAEGVLEGRQCVITPRDMDFFDGDKMVLVDVRTTMEYNNSNIPGAINIPVDELRMRMDELDKNKEIWVHCQVGLRGYIAARILSQNGYRVKNLTGGYKTYTMAKYVPERSNYSTDGVEVDPDTQIVKKESTLKNVDDIFDRALDACGLCCPGPLMQVRMCTEEMKSGEVLKVTASDPGFYMDIQSWCKKTNNELMKIDREAGMITAYIRKKGSSEIGVSHNCNSASAKDNKTLVVFSGDLDKAIASFIIANGAAAMGKKVTMFFTFWGLNILRKNEHVSVHKGFMDRMFGVMMPRGSKRLGLSRMNMLGIGGKMIRKVMKDKNVNSLEELIESAISQGIEIVACQMSMDVMGLKKDEFIEGIKIGGVGYYLGEAEDSNVNLFI
jgi:NADPH-dependent 2,4-dienoyl-CoA reductase/sulfur reductase-like enzyme/peroxiredoxin family protein/rhodanese-related sulfurtransferase/TusA-related sulfurtransferase